MERFSNGVMGHVRHDLEFVRLLVDKYLIRREEFSLHRELESMVTPFVASSAECSGFCEAAHRIVIALKSAGGLEKQVGLLGAIEEYFFGRVVETEG